MDSSGEKTVSSDLSPEERAVFDFINASDLNGLKTHMSVHRLSPNFFDEHGTSPLTQACFKGNKEISQFLVDQGADVNSDRHEHGYTALHFAALSGNSALCEMLLSANAKTSVTNSVGRTPSQMASFVGKHQCVAVINNFIPRSEVDAFTVPPRGAKDGKPPLPPSLASAVHKLISHVNLHPIRVALSCKPMVDELSRVSSVLVNMSDLQMQRQKCHEVMAFKLHYLAFLMKEIMRSRLPDKKVDPIEAFCRIIMKDDKTMEALLKECIKAFPYKETTIFRQMVTSLAGRLVDDPPPALSIVTNGVNGARGFVDDVKACVVCHEETETKKCSKCKQTQYCGRECQRLHWFIHKKHCCQN